MSAYTIADQLDFDADADGVTLHIWFPGERHLRMTWDQWDAMLGEVDKARAKPEPSPSEPTPSDPRRSGKTVTIRKVGNILPANDKK